MKCRSRYMYIPRYPLLNNHRYKVEGNKVLCTPKLTYDGRQKELRNQPTVLFLGGYICPWRIQTHIVHKRYSFIKHAHDSIELLSGLWNQRRKLLTRLLYSMKILDCFGKVITFLTSKNDKLHVMFSAMSYHFGSQWQV